jgi:hypothetical protein
MKEKDLILERILLNMKYDSRKTLSENKQILLEENQTYAGWTETYDLLGKPLRFKGTVISTVNQELKTFTTGLGTIRGSNYQNLSGTLLRALETNCYQWSEMGENEKTAMKDAFNFIKTLNVNAPYNIAFENVNYRLFFYCRKYVGTVTTRYSNGKQVRVAKPAALQTCDDWVPDECSRNTISSLGYYSQVKGKFLETFDTHLAKPTEPKKDLSGLKKYNDERKKKCIDGGNEWDEKTKKCKGVTNLADFEITAPKKSSTDKTQGTNKPDLSSGVTVGYSDKSEIKNPKDNKGKSSDVTWGGGSGDSKSYRLYLSGGGQ